MAMNITDHKDDIRTLLTQQIDKSVVDPDTGEITIETNGITIVPDEILVDAIAEIITHIVTNMEVGGVQTNIGPETNAVFTGGLPGAADGGFALQTAWKLATASAVISSQSNDGTGLVS